MENENQIKSGTDLFGNFRFLVPDKSKKTERGELFRMFLAELNPSRKKMGLSPLTESRLGLIFQGVPTEDLYYLDSVCRKARNYSEKFWVETNPKKHKKPTI